MAFSELNNVNQSVICGFCLVSWGYRWFFRKCKYCPA